MNNDDDDDDESKRGDLFIDLDYTGTTTPTTVEGILEDETSDTGLVH
jgi:hypothetical protein